MVLVGRSKLLGTNLFVAIVRSKAAAAAFVLFGHCCCSSFLKGVKCSRLLSGIGDPRLSWQQKAELERGKVRELFSFFLCMSWKCMAAQS
jgi:hypothetical protein